MGLLFRQKMQPSAFGIIRLPEIHTLDNGQSEVVLRDQSEQVVADPSTTDLKTLLDAGVDLKRVDSRVYGIRGDVSVDLGLSLNETQPAPISEPTNEGDN